MRSQSGFTLVELLIGGVTVAIVGALLISLLVQNNGVFYQQSVKVNQNIGLNDTITEINTMVRDASSVAAGYPVGSPTYTSSATTLVLAQPSIDASGNVISNTFDYVVFYKDVAKPLIFHEQLFPNAASSRKSINRILLTSFSSVTYLYYDKNGNLVAPTSAGKIKFTIQTSAKAGYGNQQASSSSQAILRND